MSAINAICVKSAVVSTSHTEAQHDSVGNGESLQGNILLPVVNYTYFVEQNVCLF
jgi:hypothetical protein